MAIAPNLPTSLNKNRKDTPPSFDNKPIWGLGLRPQHFSNHIQENQPKVFEILADNFIGHQGGPGLRYLDILAKNNVILLHSVGMNIAGTIDLDFSYLQGLKDLVERYSPKLVTDHLCFSAAKTGSSYELLPAKRNQTGLKRICERITMIQDFFKREICIENVSAYIAYENEDYSEGDFISEVVRKSGCGLLLDTNNLYINSINFDFNADEELKKLPMDAVKQIHVAGHTAIDDFLFDTHDKPVCDEVAQLTKNALNLIGQKVFCILENDDHDISFASLNSDFKRTQEAILWTTRPSKMPSSIIYKADPQYPPT